MVWTLMWGSVRVGALQAISSDCWSGWFCQNWPKAQTELRQKEAVLSVSPPTMLPLGSSLANLVWSPSAFKPSLKPSQQTLPAPGPVSFSSLYTVGPHLLSAGLELNKPHDLKKKKFLQWHQPLSRMLIRWIFLLLSVYFLAIEGIEENTTRTLYQLMPWRPSW